MSEQRRGCNFTTSIAETLECSKNPAFSDYGFAIHPCPEYDNPGDCEIYRKMDKGTSEHSLLPWTNLQTASRTTITEQGTMRVIAGCETEEDAKFIIEAVNGREELVVCIKEMYEHMGRCTPCVGCVPLRDNAATLLTKIEAGTKEGGA